MAPEQPSSSLDQRFSQAESYEALAQKHGAAEADKQASRDALNGKTIEVRSGETLGKKLLDACGGNTAEGRKLMFSMLAQITRAGFNVDYVKAGEKFTFSNSEVKIKHPNGNETALNLDGGKQEILSDTRRGTIETSREVAADIALDIYNLYLAGKAGAGIENWEKEKEVFVEAIVVLLSDRVVEPDFYETHYKALHENVTKMEAEHGKSSAEYNLAVVELLRKVRDVVKTDPNGMKELWTYVAAYMGATEEDRQGIKEKRPGTSPGSYSLEATTPVGGPEAVSVQPEAVSVQPEAVSVQPEAVSIQPEAVSIQPEAVSIQPEAVSIQPEAVSIQPEAVSVQPEAVSVQPEAVSIEPEAVSVQPEAVSIEPEAVSIEPEAVSVQPEAVSIEPEAVSTEAPAELTEVKLSNQILRQAQRIKEEESDYPSSTVINPHGGKNIYYIDRDRNVYLALGSGHIDNRSWLKIDFDKKCGIPYEGSPRREDIGAQYPKPDVVDGKLYVLQGPRGEVDIDLGSTLIKVGDASELSVRFDLTPTPRGMEPSGLVIKGGIDSIDDATVAKILAEGWESSVEDSKEAAVRSYAKQIYAHASAQAGVEAVRAFVRTPGSAFPGDYDYQDYQDFLTTKISYYKGLIATMTTGGANILK